MKPEQLENGVPKCKIHCPRCDLHFRSLQAFDDHLRIKTGKNYLGAKTRDVYCRLRPKGSYEEIIGECDLTKGIDRHTVSLWIPLSLTSNN